MLVSAYMPELPEVQTTVNGIRHTVLGRTIVHVWTDMFTTKSTRSNSIKHKTYFDTVFLPRVQGKKILEVSRRAKYILISLSGNETILIHMKMTGHIMYGSYVFNAKEHTWSPQKGQAALEDPYNRFIHVVYTLDNGYHLVLCDMRKFATVTLIDSHSEKELEKLGPEPFDKTYTAKDFIAKIRTYAHTPIKTALLNQTIIAGIGNIYSDEILYKAKILPYRNIKELSEKELHEIYKHIAPTLRTGIDMGGDSTSDYRNIYGEKGKFHGKHNTYRRTGLSCKRKHCSGLIERKIINTRSAHFCRLCQK